ncbi:alpha/beta fold hydrolase [Vibrio sp. 1180_3]|uniref:alpha/beta hydrolase n=1 Tax=Vibrio sp. 1180_3 TaxID=2528832 RepID=UPI002405D59C|nr:alpha/beta fold hydrolase [Vibrio sp. 1180_3]MDF9401126.1 alpha/beta fold hydrolase [Vibrio sp. 1180_3]
MNFLLKLLIASPLIYFVIAFSLLSLPFSREHSDKGLDFNVLHIDSAPEINIAEKYYTARDGSDLFYRFLLGDSKVIVVLIHGSGTEGRYLLPLAERLNASLNISVVLPDLRGHGKSALGSMGDVDYLGQLEHDLEDLKKELAFKFPDYKVILGGHSSGGGLVVKYGGNELEKYDGYMMLAPYLGYKAPTVRPNSGGWVQVRQARYAGLAMLNNVGIKLFNYLSVLYFNRPVTIDDEFQVDSYTFRMNESFSPQFFTADLRENNNNILVLVGENDEAFYAYKFEKVFRENAPQTDLRIILGAKHLDLSNNHETVDIMLAWLEKIYDKELKRTNR